MFSRLTHSYQTSSTYIRKKAEYTAYFLTIVLIAMIVIMALEGFFIGYTPTKLIETGGFIIAFMGLYTLFYKGHIDITISLLIIAGLGRTIMIMWYPEAFQFYMMTALCLITIAVVQTHKLQYYLGLFGFSALFIIRVYWSLLQVDQGLMSFRGFTQVVYSFILYAMICVSIHFLIGIIERDISSIERLSQQAYTDPLTGLLNRRHFYEQFENDQETLSVILFDIDHFKQVNDQYGHTIGDQVLQQMSQIVQETLPGNHHIYRWGGEEFLVALNEPASLAQTRAEQIRVAVDQEVFPKGIHLTISLGVSTRQTGQSLDQLIHQADEGLYQSKANGRNQLTAIA